MGMALAGIHWPMEGSAPMSQTELRSWCDGVSSPFKCTWNWTSTVCGWAAPDDLMLEGVRPECMEKASLEKRGKWDLITPASTEAENEEGYINLLPSWTRSCLAALTAALGSSDTFSRLESGVSGWLKGKYDLFSPSCFSFLRPFPEVLFRLYLSSGLRQTF